MPNALDDLLKERGLSASTDAPVDPLFSPLTGVAADAAAAATSAHLLKKSAGAGNARSAVDAVLSVLGESEAEIEDEVSTPASVPQVPASAFDAVPRPNGVPYHPRPIGSLSDVLMLREARKNLLPVLLSGYPGCGKTALVEAAFAENLETVGGHADTEVADLIGSYSQQPDGSYVWNDGPLVRAMREGKVLFVDDATLIPPGVLARLYPAMDGRNVITVSEHQGETVRASDGFYVVAAHNPGVHGALLSEALSSRFSIQVDVSTDLTLARKLGVQQRLVKIASKLRTLRKQGTVSWAPEMRELLTFKTVAGCFGEDIAVSNLIVSAPEADRDIVREEVCRVFPDSEALSLA